MLRYGKQVNKKIHVLEFFLTVNHVARDSYGSMV